MDKAENLQLIDGLGIVKHPFNFVLSFSRRKLVWDLTFTLLLPLSFLTLGLYFISARLVIKTNERETYYTMEANTLSRQKTLRELTSEWSEFLVFVTLYGAFVFVLRMTYSDGSGRHRSLWNPWPWLRLLSGEAAEI